MENSTAENSVIRSDDIRLAAERLALRCGIRADLNGFTYLIDAIAIYCADPTVKFTHVYRAVGAKYGRTGKSIAREINYAISRSFDVKDKLSALIGISLSDDYIHGSLVIAYLGRLCKFPEFSHRR